MPIRYLSGLSVDSTVLVVDAANDRVGIGTATPSVELAIYQSSTPRLHLQNSTSGTTSTDGFQVALSGVDGYLWNWENGTTIFGTNNAERMRITAAGNVGIGTTSPSGKLHIAAPTGTASPGSIALAIRDAGSPTFGFDFNLEGVTTGDLSLMRTVSGVQSQVMTFDRANGNVGIGTTSPATKLDVNGGINITNGNNLTWGGTYAAGIPTIVGYNAGTGGALYFYPNGSTSGEKMRLHASGNLSIGNTNDTYKLDVTGQGRLTHSAGVPALDIRASDTNFALMSIFGNQTGDVNWLLMSGYPIAGDFTIRQSDTVNALTLTKTTGAATFSSSVTAVNYSSTIANKATLATASGAINVPYTTSNINEFQTIGFSYPSSVDNVTRWGMAMTATNYAAGLADLIFFTAATERLRINTTGAATFSSSVTASSLIKSGGTSAQYLMADGSVSTLTNPVTGTGTTNYVPKWTSGSAIGDSGIFDTSGNIVINGTTAINVSSNRGNLTINGTSAILNFGISNVESGYIFHNGTNLDIAQVLAQPLRFLTTNAERMRILSGGNVLIGTTIDYTRLTVSNGNSTRTGVTLSDANTSSLMLFAGASTIASINFDTYGLRFMGGSTAGVDNGTEIMRLTTSYNVLIGTTTDAGFKLDVNGTGRFTSRLTVNATSGGNGIDIVGRTDGFGFLTFKNNANNAINAEIGVSDAQNLLFYIGSTLRLTLGSTGTLNLSAYGSGSKTGTVAYNLAVDSSGNIIETAGGVVDGSGTANYVTKWQDANTVTNSQIFDNGTNVGVNNATPKTKLDVNGTIGFGSKTMSMTDSFADALTVNMNSHNGCYVKITAFGDWGAHSTIAYLGEFFLQNGDGAYGEPGTIIRQVDNTPTDDIQAQIVDPAGSGARDFIIQLKTTSATYTPFTAYLQYEVRGQYNSVS